MWLQSELRGRSVVPVQEYIVSCSHWKGKAQMSRAPREPDTSPRACWAIGREGLESELSTHPQERQPYLLDVHLDLPSAIFVKRFEST